MRSRENYKNGGKFIPDGTLRKEITQLKKNELNWLSDVSNNVAKQAVKDACDHTKDFSKDYQVNQDLRLRKEVKSLFITIM